MPEVIYDPQKLGDGERYAALYVGYGGMSRQILAEFDLDLTAPATANDLAPRNLSGFELPAQEALTLARERAREASLRKILVIDPLGLLSHATINRYARRRP